MSDTTDTKWPYIRRAKIQRVFKILKKKKMVNGYTSGTTGSLAANSCHYANYPNFVGYALKLDLAVNLESKSYLLS